MNIEDRYKIVVREDNWPDWIDGAVYTSNTFKASDGKWYSQGYRDWAAGRYRPPLPLCLKVEYLKLDDSVEATDYMPQNLYDYNGQPAFGMVVQYSHYLSTYLSQVSGREAPLLWWNGSKWIFGLPPDFKALADINENYQYPYSHLSCYGEGSDEEADLIKTGNRDFYLQDIFAWYQNDTIEGEYEFSSDNNLYRYNTQPFWGTPNLEYNYIRKVRITALTLEEMLAATTDSGLWMSRDTYWGNYSEREGSIYYFAKGVPHADVTFEGEVIFDLYSINQYTGVSETVLISENQKYRSTGTLRQLYPILKTESGKILEWIPDNETNRLYTSGNLLIDGPIECFWGYQDDDDNYIPDPESAPNGWDRVIFTARDYVAPRADEIVMMMNHPQWSNPEGADTVEGDDDRIDTADPDMSNPATIEYLRKATIEKLGPIMGNMFDYVIEPYLFPFFENELDCENRVRRWSRSEIEFIARTYSGLYRSNGQGAFISPESLVCDGDSLSYSFLGSSEAPFGDLSEVVLTPATIHSVQTNGYADMWKELYAVSKKLTRYKVGSLLQGNRVGYVGNGETSLQIPVIEYSSTYGQGTGASYAAAYADAHDPENINTSTGFNAYTIYTESGGTHTYVWARTNITLRFINYHACMIDRDIQQSIDYFLQFTQHKDDDGNILSGYGYSCPWGYAIDKITAFNVAENNDLYTEVSLTMSSDIPAINGVNNGCRIGPIGIPAFVNIGGPNGVKYVQ